MVNSPRKGRISRIVVKKAVEVKGYYAISDPPPDYA
jgi:hypothetical protein